MTRCSVSKLQTTYDQPIFRLHFGNMRILNEELEELDLTTGQLNENNELVILYLSIA